MPGALQIYISRNSYKLLAPSTVLLQSGLIYISRNSYKLLALAPGKDAQRIYISRNSYKLLAEYGELCQALKST